MASDPFHPGLGELGQRLQALGDPAVEPPRLRPYQGSSSPAASQAAATPPPPAERPAPASAYSGWHTAPPAPAPPEPFAAPAPIDAAQQASSNGYGQTAGTSTPYPASPYPASPYPASPYPPLTGSAPQPTPNPAASTPPPASTLADPSIPSGLQRVINTVRQTLPLVQRLLPLLEGNIATAATAISALVAPQPSIQHIHHPPPPAPPAPAPVQVDLEPIERGLAEVRTSNRELRAQFAEHVTALERVEDKLEHVREATDRNTLEQQELVEDLRAVGGRVSTFAIIGLALLLLSLVLNGYLIFQLQRILH